MSADSHVRYTPERPAINARGVAWTALACLLLLGGAIGGLHALYQVDVPVKGPPAPEKFPQPRVNARESDELHGLLAAQRRELETWRWVDAGHTHVQVPIERAMRLLAQQGGNAYAPLLPPQPALSSPKAGAQRALTPNEPGTPAAAKRPPEGTQP
jgi:hypothetical protein